MTEAEKRPTAAELRGLMNPNAAATRALAESASRVLQKESKIKAAGVERIALAEIHIGERLRSVDEKQVKYLADSMNVSGLLTPISVRRVYDVMIDGAGHNKVWGLIAGAHRVAASKRLGQTHIDAFITEATDLEAQLWEVDENLIRAPLNKVERDRHILRRKEIMEAMGRLLGRPLPPVSQRWSEVRPSAQEGRSRPDRRRPRRRQEDRHQGDLAGREDRARRGRRHRRDFDRVRGHHGQASPASTMTSSAPWSPQGRTCRPRSPSASSVLPWTWSP